MDCRSRSFSAFVHLRVLGEFTYSINAAQKNRLRINPVEIYKSGIMTQHGYPSFRYEILVATYCVFLVEVVSDKIVNVS